MANSVDPDEMACVPKIENGLFQYIVWENLFIIHWDKRLLLDYEQFDLGLYFCLNIFGKYGVTSHAKLLMIALDKL